MVISLREGKGVKGVEGIGGGEVIQDIGLETTQPVLWNDQWENTSLPISPDEQKKKKAIGSQSQ